MNLAYPTLIADTGIHITFIFKIYKGNYSPHKKVKKSLTGFWGLKIEMTLLQLIVLFIGMPRSLQRISQGVTDFASKNRF